ncbi:hypothetical protein [Bacillus sp. REN3]|uniref:hypothetical protein n=1 Tax=Bacillus sp. REN3 TaxID=2802440 RepID=UPI001AEDF3D3|nr:hypothetical protein [Bacillus sp. REN3]
MTNLLKKSLNENMPVEMIYLANDSHITHRRIVVKEMHGRYFKAFCFLRNGTRLFKLENVLSVMPDRRKYLRTS